MQVHVSWWKPSPVATARSVRLGLGLGVSGRGGGDSPKEVRVSFRETGQECWKVARGLLMEASRWNGQQLSHTVPGVVGSAGGRSVSLPVRVLLAQVSWGV